MSKEINDMKKIQILGTGCPKCKTLTANAEQAAQCLGIEYELEKVQDINDIVAFGVMCTPALAIDGHVLSSGKLLSPDEIQHLIKEN
jgi:small redox-active disulfide protein 2